MRRVGEPGVPRAAETDLVIVADDADEAPSLTSTHPDPKGTQK
jgi:hypothetical protein